MNRNLVQVIISCVHLPREAQDATPDSPSDICAEMLDDPRSLREYCLDANRPVIAQLFMATSGRSRSCAHLPRILLCLLGRSGILTMILDVFPG
jgi:hypothetical protein